MKFCLFLCFFGCLALSTHAQLVNTDPGPLPGNTPKVVAGPKTYRYFLDVSGAPDKASQAALEEKVQAMPGVLQFTPKQSPPLYYVLRTKQQVGTALVTQWVQAGHCTLNAMVGDNTDEAATAAFFKTHKLVPRKMPGQ